MLTFWPNFGSTSGLHDIFWTSSRIFSTSDRVYLFTLHYCCWHLELEFELEFELGGFGVLRRWWWWCAVVWCVVCWCWLCCLHFLFSCTKEKNGRKHTFCTRYSPEYRVFILLTFTQKFRSSPGVAPLLFIRSQRTTKINFEIFENLIS